MTNLYRQVDAYSCRSGNPPEEPDEPDREVDVPEEYWLCLCTECGDVLMDDCEHLHSDPLHGEVFRCNDCGSVAHDEGEWDDAEWKLDIERSKEY